MIPAPKHRGYNPIKISLLPQVFQLINRCPQQRYISKIEFTGGISIPALPAVNATAASGINIATSLRVRFTAAIVLHTDSSSFIASHAHPVIAAVAGGLSREAVAMLSFASAVDVDSIIAPG